MYSLSRLINKKDNTQSWTNILKVNKLRVGESYILMSGMLGVSLRVVNQAPLLSQIHLGGS